MSNPPFDSLATRLPMWANLIGHVGLALLHQLAGQRVLQRTFGRRSA